MANFISRPSRRNFMTASAGLVLSRWLWAPAGDKSPVYRWRLNDQANTANESVSGATDPILSREGHATWIGEGTDRALRLDGYSVWIEHASANTDKLGDEITLAAWIALESYPVNQQQ